MRLGDIDAVKEKLLHDSFFSKHDFNTVINALNEAPTVDAVPVKHGYWRKIREAPDWDQRQCSECGDNFCCQLNYCPNCGAKMDRERVSE